MSHPIKRFFRLQISRTFTTPTRWERSRLRTTSRPHNASPTQVKFNSTNDSPDQAMQTDIASLSARSSFADSSTHASFHACMAAAMEVSGWSLWCASVGCTTISLRVRELTKNLFCLFQDHFSAGEGRQGASVAWRAPQGVEARGLRAQGRSTPLFPVPREQTCGTNTTRHKT